MIDIAAVHQWIMDHAAAVVGAPAVLGFEPKSRIDYGAIGNATMIAVWFSTAPEPIGVRPGLSSTAARIEFVIRLHRNALGDSAAMLLTERTLAIDSASMMTRLFGDIRESATNTWFDPRGQTGELVKAPTGFIDIDKQLNRVCTITLGVVVDDAWTEVE